MDPEVYGPGGRYYAQMFQRIVVIAAVFVMSGCSLFLGEQRTSIALSGPTAKEPPWAPWYEQFAGYDGGAPVVLKLTRELDLNHKITAGHGSLKKERTRFGYLMPFPGRASLPL